MEKTNKVMPSLKLQREPELKVAPNSKRPASNSKRSKILSPESSSTIFEQSSTRQPKVFIKTFGWPFVSALQCRDVCYSLILIRNSFIYFLENWFLYNLLNILRKQYCLFLSNAHYFFSIFYLLRPTPILVSLQEN